MQNWDYDPKAKTYKISMPKEDIPIEHNIYVKPPIGKIAHKLKQDICSWEDLQKFIEQSNRRFVLLWLAIVMCLIVSGVGILVAILR